MIGRLNFDVWSYAADDVRAWGVIFAFDQELMETSVEFDSEKFEPFLPEDSQVNPQVYGAELAYWLAEQLAKRGVATSYPNFEDWGWFIEYITEAGDEYRLCCGNREGANDKWRCYLVPKARSWFGRNKAPIEHAQPLLLTLRALLEETSEISNVRWSAERMASVRSTLVKNGT